MNVNVKDFGAVANDEMQTEAIQAAIDSCFLAGGGEVVVPEGEYKIGSIRLRSNIKLHLLEGAVLKGSRNPEDYFPHLNDKIEPLCADEITDAPYVHLGGIRGEIEYDPYDERYNFRRKPASRWNNAVIRAINAENVAIIGEKGSRIDGDNCYDEIGEEYYRGPHAITFFKTKNINLEGYTVENSANWAHNMLFCDNIKMNNVTVLAGHDGADFFDCRNVTVENCEFFTGDDCLAGFGNVNFFIDRCLFNSACSAMRFGGTNVTVQNCRAIAPAKYLFRGSLSKEEKISGRLAENGMVGRHRYNSLSFFTYYADYSMPIDAIPGNIIIKDCMVENCDRFLHYNFSGNETWQRYRPLRDITFENIEAKGIAMPLTLYGREDEKAVLTLRNINAAMREGCEDIPFIKACNFKKIRLQDVKIDGLKDTLILSRSEGEIELENVDVDFDLDSAVKYTDEEFVIKTI